MSTRESHRRRARRHRTKVQKVALMTDVPNWEHMDMADLSAELDRRNSK
jgi:hypothetical protein